ncbi:OmpA family protein [Hydrogenophaga sp.]|uniref:OmpA family protein n=1 Tax=Hydrogenophaga sp. TaxID=1904254 RepID=UPI002FCC581E
MSSQDNEVEYRVVAVLLVAVIVLVTGFAVGLGVHKSRGGAAKTVAAAPAAAVPAAVAAVASSDDASVVVENGVVKFYFASGKADLASGALVALGDAIAAAKAGKRLVLSGFHDATGDPAFNAELAKKRALAVRDALVGAGVAETSMELKKPEQTTGTGNDAEARRVEVMIAG